MGFHIYIHTFRVQHHYRIVGDDPAEQAGSFFIDDTRHDTTSNQPWGNVKTQVVSTPPKSPERLNWPLPVSPKTKPRQLPTPSHHDFPPSPQQEDQISEQSVEVWGDLITPRAPGQSYPNVPPISTGPPGWRLPPSAIPTSHSLNATALSSNSPTWTIPIRSHSLVDRPIDRLERPLTQQGGRSWQNPWSAHTSRSPSTYDYEDPHPGTLVDPSRIDEHCDHGPPRPETSASSLIRTFNDFAPVRKIPHPVGFKAVSIDDYFPKFSNNFAGFCKCAWRLQTQNAEKAFVIRTIIPKGPTTAAERRNSKITTLKCKKCSFEGPLTEGKATEASPSIAPLIEYAFRADRSPKSAHGVTYNWQFLFKSHIATKTILKKDEVMDPLSQTFGCLFCCAMGNGTVCFEGAPTLCGHIARHHPEGVPAGPGERELSLRVLTVIGKAPVPGQDWDIILPGHYETYDRERAFSA